MGASAVGPDSRFFEELAPVSLGNLAGLTGAALQGRYDPDQMIRRVAILGRADSQSVTYISDARHAAVLASSEAGACFIGPALAATAPPERALLVTHQPLAAYALASERLHRPRLHPAGSPSVHPEADLEDGVVLAPGVVVGPGAQIGRGTHLAAGVVVGPGVAIGRDCYVGPNAVVGFALIGDRVKIYAGAVIGESGFGATAGSHGVVDIAQLGRVILQDGVTIGANSCVDRGAYDDTVIGENTKIDNMVQIGHNVAVGRNCVMAAHTGISGSVVIGDGCQLGGRVGIADHLTIGPGARIAAAGGVMKDIPADATWGGYPARPIRQWMRETAWTTMMAARRRDRERR